MKLPLMSTNSMMRMSEGYMLCVRALYSVQAMMHYKAVMHMIAIHIQGPQY